jgi:hypothetical protein
VRGPSIPVAVVIVVLPVAHAVADPLHDRPAFLDVGMCVRHVVASDASTVAFRGTTVTEPEQPATSSFAGDLRFGVRFPNHVRLGVEAEFGQLAQSGSNIAGAYGFAGIQSLFGGVSLGAELAGGRRTIRYSTEGNDLITWLVEPRVHADVWLAPQWTLGAIAGVTLGARPDTMVGFYVGVHSALFDRDRH